MRTIGIEKFSKEVADTILEDSFDEDIGIVNKEGDLIGVVITPKAYEFFLEKVEEEEDQLDSQTVASFRKIT